MLRNLLCVCLAAALISTAAEAAETQRFELLSRTLIQGPAKTAAFFQAGLVLGTGGGIVVLSPADSLGSLSFITVEGIPNEIVVRGNIAFIAAMRGGLIVIDLSDPKKPREIYNHRMKRANTCSISGNYIFVADFHSRKLYTFELTNLLDPKLEETRKLHIPAISLTSDRDLLAVVTTRNAEIFRVQENGALVRLSEVNSPVSLKKGLLKQGILYLITSDGEVLRWNLGSPAKPQRLPSITKEEIIDLAVEGASGLLLTKSRKILPFKETNRGWFGIFKKKGQAKTAEETAKVVTPLKIDIGEPIEAIYSSAEDMPERSWDIFNRLTKQNKSEEFDASRVVFDGRRFATISGKGGVSLFSLGKDDARFQGNIPTRGFAIDLIASGDLLYVANGRDGLRIGRVHEDGSVDWVGHIKTVEARDVALSGTTLILADGRGGLKVIDVGDPHNPRIVGERSSPFFQSAVVTRGKRAYIAGGLGGVEIVDFKDTEHPKLIWREKFSEVRGIDIDNDYLYFADGYRGFRIYSLRDKKPSPVSLIDTPGWNDDIFLAGDIAYLADGGNGVRIIDIKDRQHPKELSNIDLGSLIRNIHTVGKTVFAAAHTNGIAAIDVSDPLAPRVTARFHTVDDSRGIFADDRFVYLASGSGGVYIFKYTH